MNPATQRADVRDEITALYRQIQAGSIERGEAAARIARLRALARDVGSDGSSGTDDGPAVPLAAIVEAVKTRVAAVLEVPLARIEVDAPLDRYGIDSVTVMRLTGEFERELGPLSKTLLFEYRTVGEVSRYFSVSHAASVARWLGVAASAPSAPPGAYQAGARTMRAMAVATRGLAVPLATASASLPQDRPEATATGTQAVAVIGLAGRYPQAADLDAFWENLSTGRDCITEIPSTRWDHEVYFDARKGQPGKSYSKWGGFLDGVDEFDPSFFSISPREAQLMDPQERLFLQCAYHALEDAGHTRASLGAARVGVFVGVMYEEYPYHGSPSQGTTQPQALGGSSASIANRVSYAFNLNGPSIAMDTMCSSSLTALHLACQSLRLGECELALAGGVNVSIHPNKYLGLSQGQFASSEGRCRSFGAGGDGYVPSEGVGCVLLRPLAAAEAAGDRILGVIRASAINHGGRTNGYTVPNPNAQGELIAEALRASGVDARAISYLEAHGTGTALGDPIEIAGLVKAYGAWEGEPGEPGDARLEPCAIGSVKSNIGHCESAAGIAGLTKVLLQMRHGKLAPSLHAQTLNPLIDFGRTPFRVQRELAPWRRPRVRVDGVEREMPRLAGISSFGAGGANAHVIVEEYVARAVEAADARREGQPAIVVLSARSEAQVLIQARNLQAAIAREAYGEGELAALAHTLQAGREAFEVRLATTVTSMAMLVERLASLAGETPDYSAWMRGETRRDAADLPAPETVEGWLAQGRVEPLLRAWLDGLAFDWRRLRAADPPIRPLRLPGYPFARQRYWADPPAAAAPRVARLHPLLHENRSTAFEPQFVSHFDGREACLADHRVAHARVLPGAAQLEIARAAAALSLGEAAALELTEVAWLQPACFDEQGGSLRIALFVDSETEAEFDIGSLDGDTVYSQGRLRLREAASPVVLELASLRAACGQVPLAPEALYASFAAAGLQYGPAHRAIAELRTGLDTAGRPQVLARLEVPDGAADEALVLHPSLVDGAIQATIGLLLVPGGASRAMLPARLGRVGVAAATPARGWAWLRFAEGSGPEDVAPRIDLSICDEHGAVALEIEALTLMPAPVASQTGVETLWLAPAWAEAEAPLDAPRGAAQPTREVFVAGRLPEGVLAALARRYGESRVHVAPGADAMPLAARYVAAADALFAIVRERLADVASGECLFQLLRVEDGTAGAACLDGLGALLRTASIENPRFATQSIRIDAADATDGETLLALLDANARERDSREIAYLDGRRRQRRHLELSQPGGDVPAWPAGTVALITGGLGGIGYRVAESIAASGPGTTLLLCGRSEPADAAARLGALRAAGANAEFVRTDITDAAATEALVAGIVARHGRLDTVIHSAGIVRDNFVIRKNASELHAVLAPKVAGLVNLDAATRSLPLRELIVFSSVSGAFGNAGQADYACANAFMDAFAAWRATRVAAGERSGRTLSIGWPLWAEGGMRVDAAVEAKLRRDGLAPLDTASGLAVLARCRQLPPELTQVVVLAGDAARLRARHGLAAAAIGTAASAPNRAPNPAPNPASLSSVPGGQDATRAASAALLADEALRHVKRQLAAVIRLPVERIDEDASFEEYGIDSVMAVELTDRLERACGPLSKTLLFEYQSVRDLTAFLVRHHAEGLGAALGLGEASSDGETAKAEVAVAALAAGAVATARAAGPALAPVAPRTRRRPRGRLPGRESEPPRITAIAVIGLAGRYPQAADLDAFWENLSTGRDCITEIPSTRWDHEAYFDARKGQPGKSYSKWGGFLDGVDEFDPFFFNISPREAQLMDPQERLFLQCAYHALEDAGHTRASLGAVRVGVFVGVMYEEYHLLSDPAGGDLAQTYIPGGYLSSVANRVSYFGNFRGPSFGVDTMCSSSLTALHLACQSLRLGECELALAGGVNVSIHPNKYLGLSQGQFASSEGRCRSFGAGGDGYVPSEGVGCVLLRPLAAAEAAGDRILGVIRASAINHGGRTNGYTVPNPNAQGELIAEALRASGVDARAISYLEAHGTGTALGDPIEIAGLVKAYGAWEGEPGEPGDARLEPCAIGSVKSNIGHCESAAGIAGLTKVLLQMRHGKLAPSLHAQTLNPLIDFGRTPFRVQRELAPWRRPRVRVDGVEREMPRLAGISSFGAGGANAHLIVEEYVARAVDAADARREAQPAIVVLSARSEAQVLIQARNLQAAIAREAYGEGELAALAHTLQAGREAFEVRLATTVTSMAMLVERLASLAGETPDYSAWMRGETRRDGNDALAHFAKDPELNEVLRKWLRAGNPVRIAELWTRGLDIDWAAMQEDGPAPARLRLPGYPFATKRYWMARADGSPALAARAAVPARPEPTTRAAVPPAAVEVLAEVLADAPRVAIVLGEPGGFEARTEGAARAASIRLAVLDPLDEFEPPATSAAPAAARQDDGQTAAAARQVPAGIEVSIERLRLSLAQMLCAEAADLGADVPFGELGLDSVVGVEWTRAIGREYGVTLAAATLYDHPTLTTLAAWLAATVEAGAAIATAGRDVPPRPDAHPVRLVEPNQGVATPLAAAAAVEGGNEAEVAARMAMPIEALVERLVGTLAQALCAEREEIDPDTPFAELGIDSVVGVEWVRDINRAFGTELKATVLFDHATVKLLAAHLAPLACPAPHSVRVDPPAAPVEQLAAASAVPARELADTARHAGSRGHVQAVEPAAPVAKTGNAPRVEAGSPGARPASVAGAMRIAVIGGAGRYPGAPDLDSYWRNLATGVDSVGEVPAWRWSGQPYADDEALYCRRLGALDDIEYFDPLFFNISPAEAELIDPQHRLFLQESHRAFEDAGYAGAGLDGLNCGVYLGIMGCEYAQIVMRAGRGSATGASAAIAAGRVAYHYNLNGPAIPVDTACSSSLVAIHLAALALERGEIDLALAGGVSLYLSAETYARMCEAGMLSRSGSCRSFDDGADGFVPGEGVGAVVLKRLDDALRDGDRVDAVIVASGINQDGRTNGITAPSMKSQAALLRTVHARHGIDPASIGYVEAHGTGTRLGDPIELAALATAFGAAPRAGGPCALGAVKTNLGHTSAAAGVAGLHKILLCLRHRELVPSLHFTRPNAHFEFAGSGLRLVSEREAWATHGDAPRRAALSSFGYSGTNAHLVVEEYVDARLGAGEPSREPLDLVLSAKTPAQLRARAAALLERIEDGAYRDRDLPRIAWTLLHGRAAFGERLGIVAVDLGGLAQGLRAFLEGRGVPNLFVPGGGAEDSALVRWVEGGAFDAPRVSHGECQPVRIGLPTYPFARLRCWVETERAVAPLAAAVPVASAQASASAPAAASSQDPRREDGTSLQAFASEWVIDTRDGAAAIPPGRVVLVAAREGDTLADALGVDWPEAARLDPARDGGSPETLREALGAAGSIGRLIWLLPREAGTSAELLAAAQAGGVGFGLRLVQALLALGYGTRALRLDVLTRQAAALDGEAVEPAHAGVHGLLGALAKEYPHWSVRLADLPADDSAREPLAQSLRREADPQGELLAWRGGAWHRERMVPVGLPARAAAAPFRERGVYVVIGGAGGLGVVLTEHLVRHYRARVAWIGRRPMDASIAANLDRIAALGQRPLYLQADATDARALARAREAIHADFGPVQGLVHSAIVLKDRALAGMDEARFEASLRAKVDTSVWMAAAFGSEPLDFVLFFSSMQSFLKAPGQSNYAAGCTFADAYARHLARSWPCAVKIMNWGYWGSAGVVADPAYRRRMAELGIGSIEAAEGMDAVERLLGSPRMQLAVVRQRRADDDSNQRDAGYDGGAVETAPAMEALWND
ncbi:SDR family NAD(P)-dependent oxidoreductase [Burkholderia gladioli]|uniref:SDR family NAD(P)-dependent oxidoreductase n=4 Tax=Burkholderia gladioli TaxID=28095 RepID=UPI001640BD3E|nr:SDR family NAD(P)-dependent oxidoreductase [Burkholderia gladioli]